MGGVGSKESVLFRAVRVWRSLRVNEPTEGEKLLVEKEGVISGAMCLGRREGLDVNKVFHVLHGQGRQLDGCPMPASQRAPCLRLQFLHRFVGERVWRAAASGGAGSQENPQKILESKRADIPGKESRTAKGPRGHLRILLINSKRHGAVVMARPDTEHISSSRPCAKLLAHIYSLHPFSHPMRLGLPQSPFYRRINGKLSNLP